MLPHFVDNVSTTHPLVYPIDPAATTVIANDISGPGHWTNQDFDQHIDHCVNGFIDFVEKNEVVKSIFAYKSLEFIGDQSDHPRLESWMTSHHITGRHGLGFHDASFYLGCPQIFVWGIHTDCCILNTARILTHMSPISNIFILQNLSVALYEDIASLQRIYSNFPRVQLINTDNCMFVGPQS